MKLKILVLIVSILICSQAFANAAVMIMERERLQRDRQSTMHSYQLNASGAIDLTGRRICDLTNDDYYRVKYCTLGDVIMFKTDYDDEKMFPRMFRSCKLDEPIYFNGRYLVCVYEDNREKVKIYRPSREKKDNSIKTIGIEQHVDYEENAPLKKRIIQLYELSRQAFLDFVNHLIAYLNK